MLDQKLQTATTDRSREQSFEECSINLAVGSLADMNADNVIEDLADGE